MDKRVALEELDVGFVKCRTVGHAWDVFNPVGMARPQYGWRLSLRCVTCGTERHDQISRKSGALESRSYVYPELYRMEAGVTRDEVRMEMKKVYKMYLSEQSMFRDLEGGKNGSK